jgi:hypothetical protein
MQRRRGCCRPWTTLDQSRRSVAMNFTLPIMKTSTTTQRHKYWRQPTIHYTARPAPTAVALVTDRLDGTYELEFVALPKSSNGKSSSSGSNAASNATTEGSLSNSGGDGLLTIYFVYTWGIGHAFQPIKDSWPTGGGTRISHSIRLTINTGQVVNDGIDISSILESRVLETNHQLSRPLRPPMRPFQPPDISHRHVLNSFTTRIAVGDSLMGQFVEAYRHVKPNPRIVYEKNIWKILTRSTLDYWLQCIEEWHGPVLSGASASASSSVLPTGTNHGIGNASSFATTVSSTATTTTTTTTTTIVPTAVALILGSSSWDVLHSDNVQPYPGSLLTDHLFAVQSLIETLRQRYPQVQIFWKSPSAMVRCLSFKIEILT